MKKLILTFINLFIISSLYAQPVEVIEKRTANGKVFRMDDGKFQGIYGIGFMHYKDEQGKFQDIDSTPQASDNPSYDRKIDKTPYKLYISNKGARRFYPDRNDLTKYIEVKAPGITGNKNGNWVGNTLKWDSLNFDVQMIAENDRVKFLCIVKKPIAFNSISFEITENGVNLMDVLGGAVYSDSTEPFSIERRLGLDYQNGVLTLSWDFTGMVYPITVDPTFAVSQNADDAFIYEPTTFADNIALDFGQFAAPTNYNAAYARFQNVNIPNASTIDSAYLTFTCRAARTTPNTNLYLALENVDNAGTIANYNTFVNAVMATTTPWPNVENWTTAGTNYTTPDMSLSVQDIVNRAGWVSGNAMNTFIRPSSTAAASGNPNRLAASYNNTSYSEPRLTLTWTVPATAAPKGQVIFLGWIGKFLNELKSKTQGKTVLNFFNKGICAMFTPQSPSFFTLEILIILAFIFSMVRILRMI